MIIFENVNKIYNENMYDEVIALKNINLKINDNDLILLKGVSGSGKTTFLNLISAITKPTTGAIFVNKIPVSKIPDNFASEFRQNQIGIIFQNYNLLESFTLLENILIPILPLKNKNNQFIKRANNLIKQFDLIDKKNTAVKFLSGGQKQRVAIARALINNPQIIIADEPTAHLDTKLCDEFIKYIKKIKNDGKTIIIATHDDRLLKLSEKIYQIKDGSLC